MNENQPIQIIISDFDMPGQTGGEAFLKLKILERETKIKSCLKVLLSGGLLKKLDNYEEIKESFDILIEKPLN